MYVIARRDSFSTALSLQGIGESSMGANEKPSLYTGTVWTQSWENSSQNMQMDVSIVAELLESS